MTRKPRVYGATKCLECHKPFTDGDEVVEVDGQERVYHQTSVPGYSIGGYRAIKNKWHKKCWDDVAAWIGEVRARAATDNTELIAAIQSAIEAEKHGQR